MDPKAAGGELLGQLQIRYWLRCKHHIRATVSEAETNATVGEESCCHDVIQWRKDSRHRGRDTWW